MKFASFNGQIECWSRIRFIRGWLIGSVLLLGLTAFEVQTERLKGSGLAPYFLPGSRVIAILTPYELKAKFLVGYRAMERWWREH